ncbi:MAG TPA: type IV pilus assembly protein PilM [Chthoniobacterales bacterium]|jgi:type IV pilus assembly protein PilM
MTTSPQIVSLNLGSQTLSLARFQVQPGDSLVLTAYERREILCDPLSESDHARQIAEALPGMLRGIGVKRGPVHYAVSSQAVFTRFVRLPSVDSEKIERIIGFEAQQNVPFPIDEVVWDYQVVGSELAQGVEVVLVAIKADLLEGINAAVEGAGLQTQLVDVSSMALCNAFRHNYPELTDCSLVIDIGARTTNLLFVEPGKIFSRSIPIGGSSITSSIAKEFGESFAVAELRKKRDGLASPSSSDEGLDLEMARVCTIARKTVTRLHAELMRSISFYRTQQGSQPERVFLCGGTGAMPRLREFFHEKLQRPIEFLNPLRNVTLGCAIVVEDVAPSDYLLGELVGLACRSSMSCPMELSLRPASVVRRQRLAKRQPFFGFAATCFILGLLGWAFYFMGTAHLATQLADGLQDDLDRMQGVERRLKQLSREIATLDAAATPLLRAIEDRDAWPRILDDLNARLPKEDIWITELAPTSGGRVVDQGFAGASAAAPIPVSPQGHTGSHLAKPAKSERMIDGVFVRGLYLYNPKQQEVVVDYFRNLIGSNIFEVDPDKQSEVIRPSTPTNTEWAYSYELRLKLRHPFALP